MLSLSNPKTSWTNRLIKIAFLNIFAFSLLISFLLSYRSGFWFGIDSTVFHFFNQYLTHSNPLFLYVAAITNHRLFDLISLVTMGLIYYSYFKQQNNYGKRQMLCLGLLMLILMVLIKQWGTLLPIAHASPTYYFGETETINRVSQLTHFGTKDASRDSFLGDHGMALMIFAGFMWRYFGYKAGLKGIACVILFSLPRIIVGAHWFTDVYIGSLTISCITLSWFLLTPLCDWLISAIIRLLPKKLYPIKKHESL